MTINEFIKIKDDIKANAVKVSTEYSTYEDDKGNIYRIEDGGYSQVLLYNKVLYHCNWKNEITEIRMTGR